MQFRGCKQCLLSKLKMDPDLISDALRTRAQVITMQRLLSGVADSPVSVDDYENLHREAISTALKEEQKCEDLLADRQQQLNEIRELSAMMDPEKLKLAKELLRKKEELTKKRDELYSFLKSKNLTLSDLLARKNHVVDHSAKIAYLEHLRETCKELKDEIAMYEACENLDNNMDI
ncbi:hypothetical protein RB195_002396 [Necator americanus]|uniref:Uncharacterized protein n=1 Tax=Necator americanus TaxID=51031 RepID=A0ABR1DIV3_NECAM